jgi:hypothetical protein
MYQMVMVIIILFPWTILAAMATINLSRRHRQVNVQSR